MDNDFDKAIYVTIFDVTFFILVTTVGLNIIFGIIVDTFSQLRDAKVMFPSSLRCINISPLRRGTTLIEIKDYCQFNSQFQFRLFGYGVHFYSKFSFLMENYHNCGIMQTKFHAS